MMRWFPLACVLVAAALFGLWLHTGAVLQLVLAAVWLFAFAPASYALFRKGR